MPTQRKRRFERIIEIALTSERKLMSALGRDHEHGDDCVPVDQRETCGLLGRCSRVRVGLQVLPLDDSWYT